MERLKNMSLARRLMVAMAALLVVIVTANYVIFLSGYRKQLVEALGAKAASFTATADETKNHVSKLHADQVFKMDEMLAELKQAQESGKSYRETRIFQTIPVVAGWTAAKAAAEREKIEFKIPAFNARSKDNSVDVRDFRGQMLADLTKQVEGKGEEVLTRIDPKANTLHYMRAIRLTEDCMRCHGDPASSPTKDGKDVTGFPMENWKAGGVHGAYEVIMPLNMVDQQARAFILKGLAISGPLLLVGLFLLGMLMRTIFAKPITAMVERIQDIALGEGDLTKRLDVRSKDELGELSRWFNVFIEKIHDIVAEVRKSSLQVASAATEVAASSEEMAHGLQGQMANVTQITAAVEEMSCSIQEVARRASDAVSHAKASGELAEQGGVVIGQTIEGMENISQAVESSATSVLELGRRSEQIGDIIQVIKDIAEQTNLLALNAAIEAARAGEQGRGFAVVADEVRKLAERTGHATQEVTTSIKAIQTETGQAVERMQAGRTQVTTGVTQSRQAGSSLDEIVGSARDVANLIEEIAAATQEQSTAGQQISRNLEQIASVSQETSQGASQAAEASCQLSREAERMNELVRRFKVAPSAER